MKTIRLRPISKSLESLVTAACTADVQDAVVAQVGDDEYSTIFGIIPDILAVLRSAAAIERDQREVLLWYRHTKIAELGWLTAQRLLTLGRSKEVIAFLQSARDGGRG